MLPPTLYCAAPVPLLVCVVPPLLLLLLELSMFRLQPASSRLARQAGHRRTGGSSAIHRMSCSVWLAWLRCSPDLSAPRRGHRSEEPEIQTRNYVTIIRQRAGTSPCGIYHIFLCRRSERARQSRRSGATEFHRVAATVDPPTETDQLSVPARAAQAFGACPVGLNSRYPSLIRQPARRAARASATFAVYMKKPRA